MIFEASFYVWKRKNTEVKLCEESKLDQIQLVTMADTEGKLGSICLGIEPDRMNWGACGNE